MTTKDLKLSIIIVSWNVKQELIDCLRSIEENPPTSGYEVITVDNASTDGTIETLQSEFPKVKLIVNKENRGFAAANNVGTKQAQGEYILYLNPDTIVHPGSLDILLNFLDNNKDVGACGPKLLNDDGTLQPSIRKVPDFRSALYQNTILRRLGLFRNNYRKYRMLDFDFEKQIDVDVIMGAALMVRHSIIKEIDGMDEAFFMYYEEADLCYRVQKAGWRIVFLPESQITHLGGKSSDQVPVKTKMMRLRSLLIFFRKHYGKVQTCFFNLVFKPAVLLRYVIDFFLAIMMYLFALLLMNKTGRRKYSNKIKYSLSWLREYAWEFLIRF
ncbi:MAG: glycosyltransferase family 2 protein [Sedimentisphaerales bacterium]|nr:glycosyltransferase family 2 protein [Sedimentisphaerales bacterium]